MSDKPSLRGAGDTLTKRLLETRADILARGVPFWQVTDGTAITITVRKPDNLQRVFNYFRKRGASFVDVYEKRSLHGMSVFVNSGVRWLLLSSPVRL